MARGHSLGLILPDSSNPYFALLARAVEEVAYRHGYPLLVGNAADTSEREIGYLHAFVDRQVEGILVIPTAEDEVLEEEFAKVGVPLVVLDRSLDDAAFANVVAASVEAPGTLSRHLIEHGHTRIACLSGPAVSVSEERVAGFQQALADAGLEPGRVLSRPFGGAPATSAAGAAGGARTAHRPVRHERPGGDGPAPCRLRPGPRRAARPGGRVVRRHRVRRLHATRPHHREPADHPDGRGGHAAADRRARRRHDPARHAELADRTGSPWVLRVFGRLRRSERPANATGDGVGP